MLRCTDGECSVVDLPVALVEPVEDGSLRLLADEPDNLGAACLREAAGIRQTTVSQ